MTAIDMDIATQKADALRRQIVATEAELAVLKKQLAEITGQDVTKKLEELDVSEEKDARVSHEKWPLSPGEYQRYGRQMIVPSVGIQGRVNFHTVGLAY